MRQKDLADVQHHLKADLLRCRLVCGLEKGPQHFTAHMGGLKEGFFNLRTNLHFVLEKEAGRDDQRRQDWMQVLDKSKEWEKKAEKLVDSLDSLQSHQLLEEEGDERDQYRSVAWRSGASPSPHSPSAVTIPQRNLSTRPASPYPNGQYVGREKKIGPSAHCGLKDSEGMQHLLTVQKRLKNLQSVEFQRNIKGLLRTS
ncbi:uncharacterized protein ACWYII_001029 isoform 2-T4 [Salvelinus alpinus]|uniref:uncharacterized protein isoform X1 n=1 Tax=Salvelinus alpinus TaxID=8036 RepID=UPI0039FD8BB5